MNTKKPLISIIIPCYNEGPNINTFYKLLASILSSLPEINYEIIYVNDGSRDDTLKEINRLAKTHRHIKIVCLSRNFGKEIATTAGIHQARGDALITLDGDGQHPPELIPLLIKKWQDGAKVVVGVRSGNQKVGVIKKFGSKMFYSLFNKFTGAHLVPGSTDFRLIDQAVQSEFVKMTEHNRITRGLIDWLGFKREYITFSANARLSGEASYSTSKLFKLALNSFISLSLAPLYFALYAGLIILPLSFFLGCFMVIETLIGDPLNLNITGSGFVVMLILFLIGVLLISQGIIAIYLSHIQTETQNRPLYVLDKANSYGFRFDENFQS